MQAGRDGVGGSLPEPGEDALDHSERLTQHVAERIRAAGGAIGFAEYMRLVLYAPGLGYYSAGARKFGADGDFVTAPELGPLFSRLLARQCAEILAELGRDAGILEIGAGGGALAAGMLAALGEADALPERYCILEVSADLRERQRRLLERSVPEALHRVVWLDALPESPLRGVIVANEVLDALPVERFRRTADGVEQAAVAEGGGELVLHWIPAAPTLARAVMELESRLGRRLPDGYTSELSLGLAGWLGDVARVLAEGVALFADYGAGESEYYAAGRIAGTFRCHYRHRAHENALLYPGLQDLTAWVDFSAVAHAAVDAGLELLGYTTQANFLIGAGLARELEGLASLGERQRLALSQQTKTLTLPAEMGELVKFIGLGRDYPRALSGFRLADLRHRL